MLNLLKNLFFAAVMLVVFSASVRAQSITLHEGDLSALLNKNAISSDDLWIVNGKNILKRGDNDQRIGLGKLSAALWNVAALRLIEMKLLDADRPVSDFLDDIEIDNPFRKRVTLRHLLAGTAGFATPPFHATTLEFTDNYSVFPIDNDWRKYLSLITEPGLGARDDLVGQALLAKVILSVMDNDINQVLQELVFAPLDVQADLRLPEDILNYTYDAFFAPVVDISISTEAFGAFLSMLTDNRRAGGERYLSLAMHEALMKGAAWKVHPLGPGRSYGFATGEINARRSASILPSEWRRHAGQSYVSGMVAFPDAGIVIAMSEYGADSKKVRNKLLKVAGVIASENIPRTSYFRERKLLENVTEVYPRNGYFMLDETATSWLAEKLNRAKYHSPYISVKREAVTVTHGGEQKLYHRVEPRFYQSSDGERLYLSEGNDGNIAIGGSVYRYTGAMGNPYLLISPFFICLITLLSAGIYWNSKRGKDWRRFARWTVVGALCFTAGYYAEVMLYPTEWSMEHNSFYVLLWRLVFNIGLMLLLTAPMYAWRFGKQNSFHENARQIMVGSHVIVIAAAALVFALLSVGWGLAGELLP